MSKEYMIGTLDDAPLQMVTYNGVKYLVDRENQEVFLDDKGLPRVTKQEIITAVLEAAQ